MLQSVIEKVSAVYLLEALRKLASGPPSHMQATNDRSSDVAPGMLPCDIQVTWR